MVTLDKTARERWCPFSHTVYAGIGLNRMTLKIGEAYVDEIKADTRCIASDCMAWRWAHRIDGMGYCGLAGAPVEK